MLDLSDIDIVFSKKSKSYDLQSVGNQTYVYYELTWTAPYTDEDISYTLVCYDENRNFMCPVKTLKGNERQITYVGNVSKTSGNYVYNMNDNIATGTKYFRIIAVDGNQNIAVSKLQQFIF